MAKRKPQTSIVARTHEALMRIFEQFPADGMTRFKPGDKVKLIRIDLYWDVPVGAIGIVQAVASGEDAMAVKGKPYQVKFDVRPFNIPVPQAVHGWLKKTNESAPQYQSAVTSFFSPNDLELVEAAPRDAVVTQAIKLSDYDRLLLEYFGNQIPNLIIRRQTCAFSASLLTLFDKWREDITDEAALAALVVATDFYRTWQAAREATALVDTITPQEYADTVPPAEVREKVYAHLQTLGWKWYIGAGIWVKVKTGKEVSSNG